MDKDDPSVPVVIQVQGAIDAVDDREVVGGRLLTDEEFHRLRDVPAVLEWLRNIPNERTRIGYGRDVAEFIRFVGIRHPDEFRLVTSAHVIAYRDSLQSNDRIPRPCSDATVKRKLSALASLFDYLCERHAVAANVVLSVRRPKSHSGEGSTPAISDEHMRELLNAPPCDTLKGIRDRAILSTLGYHGLRESELCGLSVADYTRRDGVMQFKVHGKGSKIRYVPVHPVTQSLIAEYLDLAGHGAEMEGALFRPIKNNRTKAGVEKALSPTAVYTNIVLHYAKQIGITIDTHGFCVHSMRVTFGTNAWENGADIVDIQKTLGHANISTTRGYLRQRKETLERSPSFKVKY